MMSAGKEESAFSYLRAPTPPPIIYLRGNKTVDPLLQFHCVTPFVQAGSLYQVLCLMHITILSVLRNCKGWWE